MNSLIPEIVNNIKLSVARLISDEYGIDEKELIELLSSGVSKKHKANCQFSNCTYRENSLYIDHGCAKDKLVDEIVDTQSSHPSTILPSPTSPLPITTLPPRPTLAPRPRLTRPPPITIPPRPTRPLPITIPPSPTSPLPITILHSPTSPLPITTLSPRPTLAPSITRAPHPKS
jgi:hypothetical protein